MKLTIAIPTYQRCDALEHTLRQLSGQLVVGVELLVIDNASSDNTQSMLSALLVESPALRVARILRNEVNVGGNTNIIRCVEKAGADWVWILGDDDVIRPDAIEIVLRNISSHSDCVWFNFYSPSAPHAIRVSSRVAEGAVDALSQVKSVGELLFVSSTVFRRESVIPFLRYAYHAVDSFCPQLALGLWASNRSGKVLLSSETIVTFAEAKDEAAALPSFAVLFNLSKLFELNWPPGVLSALRMAFAGDCRTWLRIRACLYRACLSCGVNERSELAYKIKILKRRLRSIRQSPSDWFILNSLSSMFYIVVFLVLKGLGRAQSKSIHGASITSMSNRA